MESLTHSHRNEIAGKLNPHLLSLIPIEQAEKTAQIEPQSLLTPARFDLPAKLLYARYREEKIESDFALRLYDEHLRAFNGHEERDGSGKSGLQGFLDAFHQTLDSVKGHGFDPELSLVPVGADNTLIDGAHRVAAAFLHQQPVSGVIFNWIPRSYDFRFFSKRGLSEPWLDAMAFEYCRLKQNIYLATVFPSATGKADELEAVVNRHGRIVYTKDVRLNFRGAVNLMRQIYANEPWLGDWKTDFSGARSKARECFRRPGPVRLIAFEAPALEAVKQVKDRIRGLFDIGNHSVHINDTHEQAILIAQLLLNRNSVHFLNHAEPRYFDRFVPHFAAYRRWLSGQRLDPEHFCIDGSAVLAAYGLRDARDLDFLHFGPDTIETGHPKIGSHNSEMQHHVFTRDDILFNPENHFYYHGIKFASLEVIRRMKTKRGEDKDRQDVVLMDTLAAPPPVNRSRLAIKLRRWIKVYGLEMKRRFRKPYTFSKRWFSHAKHWRQHLLPWAEERQPLNMLEIGSYEGASTCWLLEHLTDHPGARLTCVDQWKQQSGQRVYHEDMEEVYQTFLKNIRATDKANRVTVLRGSTREVLPGIQDQRFDLIYIDGDHSAEGVYYDSLQAFRLVHDGGMILWDDYHHAASVKQGVDRACREAGVKLHWLGKNVYCIK